MIDLSLVICFLAGHDPTKPEIVAWRRDGLVVVTSWCVRCGTEFLGCVSEESLRDGAAEDEGPWGTVPCLMCRRDTLRSESAVPEMWPCSAVCPECRETWERL